MKGFKTVRAAIAEWLENWAMEFARYEAGPTDSEWDIENRGRHHAEYLNGYCDKTGWIRLNRYNGEGYFISLNKEVVRKKMDQLEAQINQELEPTTHAYGMKLNERYCINESELDKARLAAIAYHMGRQPHFKHLDPIKDEVVLDVSEF